MICSNTLVVTHDFQSKSIEISNKLQIGKIMRIIYELLM